MESSRLLTSLVGRRLLLIVLEQRWERRRSESVLVPPGVSWLMQSSLCAVPWVRVTTCVTAGWATTALPCVAVCRAAVEKDDAPPAPPPQARNTAEAQAAAFIQQYNSIHRPLSLMEMHQQVPASVARSGLASSGRQLTPDVGLPSLSPCRRLYSLYVYVGCITRKSRRLPRSRSGVTSSCGRKASPSRLVCSPSIERLTWRCGVTSTRASLSAAPMSWRRGLLARRFKEEATSVVVTASVFSTRHDHISLHRAVAAISPSPPAPW